MNAVSNSSSMRLVLAVASVALVLVVPVTGRAAGPNLLPNPSFEASAFEPGPVPRYTLEQPLLPEGWVFEGSAGLFDHYPAGSGGREVANGQRAIAISIPASSKDDICADPPVGCHDNPINPVRDGARLVYSVTPHWRTALPVAVTPNAEYRLSAWTQLDIVTAGEGSSARVRWLDGNGVPIGENLVWTRRVTGTDSGSVGLVKTGTVRAPAGARQAHVLLGHTDDLWIGQARFDAAFFGLD